MTKQFSYKLLIVALSLSVSGCAVFQSKDKKASSEASASAKPESQEKNSIKPYDKVITKAAKTDEGLFTVHQIADDYYYEIPDSLFNREMLMVTRIAQTASGIGFGGGKTNEQVLRWEKKNNRVLLRVVSHDVYAADTLPIHEAVVNSNLDRKSTRLNSSH